MKTIAIAAIVIVVLYIACKSYSIMSLDIELDKVLKQGAIVLDVRTEREFNTGHIDGAVNIPLSRLHADSVPLDKSKTIITCCSHGLRSVKAVSLLKEHGYTHVHNGGAWVDLQKIVATANIKR